MPVRSPRVAFLLALSAALGLAAGGCRQIVGFDGSTHPTPDPPAASEAGGFPYGTTACASCVHTNCRNESLACTTEAPWVPYRTWGGHCGGRLPGRAKG